MLFENLTEAAPTLDVDVAVYGGGPAGITLALALARGGKRVGLFEAGALAPPGLDAEHPYNAQNLGRPYDLLATRLRYFGGTTNHWGGWVRPLDPYDLVQRPFQPMSGWPLSPADLQPHYQQAMRLCEVPEDGMGLAAFDHDFRYDDYLHERHPQLVFKNFLFSPPTRFGMRYREDVASADSLQCYLNATLTRLRQEGDAVASATLVDADGTEAVIRAGQHVLAMGAVENARMLLHSGLANSSDFVGRCFSDHLGTTVGEAIVDSASRYVYQKIGEEDKAFPVMPHLSLSDDLLHEHQLSNFGIVFLSSRQVDDPLTGGIRRSVSSAGTQAADRVKLLVRMETTPNPDSRIRLSDQQDAFGIPRVTLDWQVNRRDFDSVQRLGDVIRPLMSIAGARIRMTDSHLNDAVPRASYQAHHLGTTRMSDDPSLGVVDSNLRSHDLDNLYIAGSSVFPTFGFANPTLTLLALSLRLSDHLLERDA